MTGDFGGAVKSPSDAFNRQGKVFFSFRKMLHYVAASIFVILIAVHIAALLKGIAWLHFQNTIFPFATNKLMMVLATVFELILAIYCSAMAGRKPADFCVSSSSQ